MSQKILRQRHRRTKKSLAMHLPFVSLLLLLFMCPFVNSLTTPLPQKLLIFGLGRVGIQVAKTALSTENEILPSPSDIEVVGTVRKLDGSMENDDIKRIFIRDKDLLRKQLFGSPDRKISPANNVLYTIPLTKQQFEPETDDSASLVAVWDLIQEWLCDSSTTSKRSLAILSTSGVYGNHDGAVVTEDSPLLCQPESNAHLYKQFEEHWIKNSLQQQADSSSNQLYIFRCAGIYDESASALHTVFRQGYKEPKPSNEESTATIGKTNRIHAADIAQVLLTAMFGGNLQSQSTPHCVYNLADDKPEARNVVLSYAKKLLQSNGVSLPEPTDKTTGTNSSQTRLRRRQTELKLVSNEKLKQELLMPNGLELQYPTYREGLQATLKAPSTPWQQRKVNNK